MRKIRIPVDLVTGVVFFLVASRFAGHCRTRWAISEKDVVNGRAFPTLLTGVMLLCCAMLIGKELYKLVTKQPLELEGDQHSGEIKALVILGILVVTYLLSKLTGLFVVGAVFCCLGFLLYFRCRKKSYYVITLVLAVAIWAAFRFALGVDF